MLLVQLVQELIAIGQGILSHFVNGEAATVSLSQDFEWVVNVGGGYNLLPKGQYLAGAAADIVTYGAILVDWIVQSLITSGATLNVAAAP